MGRHIRPASVYQTVTNEINNAIFPSMPTPEPPWYKVIARIPPAETLIRPIRVEHRAPLHPKKKPRNLYRPQHIAYFEDSLRNDFFKDHPWELARPRIVLESDGKDYQLADWSTGVQQEGLPLTGESVVQRQLWLMENKKQRRRQAYDTARREFYKLRQAEEIEKRVALEEARHVGAYFGLNRGDVARRLEDREFENWKVWAEKENRIVEVAESQAIDTFDVPAEEEEEAAEIVAPVEEEA